MAHMMTAGVSYDDSCRSPSPPIPPPDGRDSWSPPASGRTDQAFGRPRPLNKAILYGENSSR
jgi:hypothetical protein